MWNKVLWSTMVCGLLAKEKTKTIIVMSHELFLVSAREGKERRGKRV